MHMYRGMKVEALKQALEERLHVLGIFIYRIIRGYESWIKFKKRCVKF